MHFLGPSSDCNSMMYLCRIWIKSWLRYLQSFFPYNLNISAKQMPNINQHCIRGKGYKLSSEPLIIYADEAGFDMF
jgi:hypothetical protein